MSTPRKDPGHPGDVRCPGPCGKPPSGTMHRARDGRWLCRRCCTKVNAALPRSVKGHKLDRTEHVPGDHVVWSAPAYNDDGRASGRTIATRCVVVSVARVQMVVRCDDGSLHRASHEMVRPA